MFKKIIAAVLSVMLALTFASCNLPFGGKSESEQLSDMASDEKTVDMIIKEAINNYAVGNGETTYNGKTAYEATVEDVLKENNYSTEILKHKISGVEYTFVFTKQGSVTASGGQYDVEGMELTPDTTIQALYNWKTEDEESSDSKDNESSTDKDSGDVKEPSSEDISKLEQDCADVDRIIKEAVNTYKTGNKITIFNGKTADECTVEDVLTENKMETSVLSRKIEGETYTFVYTIDGSVKISGGEYKNNGIALTEDKKISELADSNKKPDKDTATEKDSEKDTEKDKTSDTSSSEESDSTEEINQLEKDKAAVNILIKEAVLNYKTNNTDVKYNGNTVQKCTVEDVLAESDMTTDVLTRKIDGNTYSFVYTKNGTVEILGGKYKSIGTVLKAQTTIASLVSDKSDDSSEDEKDSEEEKPEKDTEKDTEKEPDNNGSGESTMESVEKDRETVEMLIKSAVNMYMIGDSDSKYNGKTIDKCTVGDVLAENGISDDVLKHDVDGTEYTYVYTKKGTVAIKGGLYKNEGKAITKDITISALAEYKGTVF